MPARCLCAQERIPSRTRRRTRASQIMKNHEKWSSLYKRRWPRLAKVAQPRLALHSANETQVALAGRTASRAFADRELWLAFSWRQKLSSWLQLRNFSFFPANLVEVNKNDCPATLRVWRRGSPAACRPLDSLGPRGRAAIA